MSDEDEREASEEEEGEPNEFLAEQQNTCSQYYETTSNLWLEIWVSEHPNLKPWLYEVQSQIKFISDTIMLPNEVLNNGLPDINRLRLEFYLRMFSRAVYAYRTFKDSLESILTENNSKAVTFDDIQVMNEISGLLVKIVSDFGGIIKSGIIPGGYEFLLKDIDIQSLNDLIESLTPTRKRKHSDKCLRCQNPVFL